MILSLHHISLIVSSDETVDFYKRLGFTVEKEINRENDRVLLMNGFGISLELFIDPKYPVGKDKKEQTGIRFLSFKAENLDNLVNSLSCGPVRTDWNGQRYTFVQDPDGTMIQFHE